MEWKMKRCRFLILAAFVATMPNMVYAQSICDTIFTIAKNVSQSYKRSSQEYLELLTLPGATCNFEEYDDSYTCYWSKPHNNASVSALRAWSVNVEREAKIFTGRVKACLGVLMRSKTVSKAAGDGDTSGGKKDDVL